MCAIISRAEFMLSILVGLRKSVSLLDEFMFSMGIDWANSLTSDSIFSNLVSSCDFLVIFKLDVFLLPILIGIVGKLSPIFGFLVNENGSIPKLNPTKLIDLLNRLNIDHYR